MQVTEGMTATCRTYAVPNADCNLITQYTYDRAGNRTRVTNARGYFRTFTYSIRDELVRENTELHDFAQRYSYSRSGLLLDIDYDLGVEPVYHGYDELGRMTSRNGQSWIYDALGRMLTFTDSPATRSPDAPSSPTRSTRISTARVTRSRELSQVIKQFPEPSHCGGFVSQKDSRSSRCTPIGV